jgi:hypothetical protein
MADIDQDAPTDSTVRFTARSVKGDEWMRLHYDSIEVTFELPSEVSEAQIFKNAANLARLKIADLASS